MNKTRDGNVLKDSRTRLLADLLLSMPPHLRGVFQNAVALAGSFGILLLPTAASAHEVYVLNANQIAVDLSEPPFDMVRVMLDNMHQFLFWGFVAFVVVSTVFFISIFRVFERAVVPLFRRVRPFAPAVARITVGFGLLASSYYGASFGPELPLTSTYGDSASAAAFVLAVLGTLIVIGFWARAAALAALGMFAIGVMAHGSYMLTYTSYVGEFLVLLIIGSHRVSVHSLTGWSERFSRLFQTFVKKLEPLAFPMLRVCFGISLIFSSAYAKILHNNLALQVASLPIAGHPHSLAYYFGFEPHFLVLGAAIIELLIGFFFIFGLEIRWTSIFLLFWLSLSLWYFGESVWPHIILIGIPVAFIMHGYDEYSLEGRFFRKGRLEPAL